MSAARNKGAGKVRLTIGSVNVSLHISLPQFLRRGEIFIHVWPGSAINYLTAAPILVRMWLPVSDSYHRRISGVQSSNMT
jgi:hypothetical protein